MNNNQDILPVPDRQPNSSEFASTDISDESQASKMTELSGSTVSTNPIVPGDSRATSAPVSSLASTAVSSTGIISLTTDLDADDVDLIEKEWIKKAKDIVAMTLNDPHEQNKQLNQMKKEYIQKRFNKTIKSRDE